GCGDHRKRRVVGRGGGGGVGGRGAMTDPSPVLSNFGVLVLGALLGLALAAVGYWLRLKATGRKLGDEADKIRRAAEAERQQLLRSAEIDVKEALLKVQQEHEAAVKAQREELAGLEKRL